MHTFLQKIATVIIAPIVGLFSLAGHNIVQPNVPPPDNSAYIEQISEIQNRLAYLENETPSVGASFETPNAQAFFETSLASSISSSATSFTLVSATTDDGTTLASSTYGFIIDEGTASQEMVLADCTGTACTNVTRGLSSITGTTTIAAKQFAHRRGASVKITTGPSLVFALNVLTGKQNIEFPLRYGPGVSTTTLGTNDQNIASVAYANSLSFGAVPAASETASGFVELATGAEAAAGTSAGSTGARLAIPASLATSTYNAATAANRIPVTGSDGKVDGNLISTSTLNAVPVGSISAYASTTAPHGWLLLDGSCVSRTTYASLYAVLGTYYDVGCTGSQFGLPNATGRSLVMASSTQTATSTTNGTPNTRSTLGYKGGETTHTQTVNEIAAHTHTVDALGSADNNFFASGASATIGTDGATAASTGGSTPFNVLDPYIIVNYIIKY